MPDRGSVSGETAKALEAAAEALGGDFGYAAARPPAWASDTAKRVVAAYFDSLLGDIPEEAVEAWEKAYWTDDEETEDALRAFLRSLRRMA